MGSAGLRALLKKDAEAIERLVTLEQVDVLCLQEHKLQEKHVTEIEEQVLIDGWAACWSCSVKPGYSGTCILYRKDAFDGAEPSLKCGIGCEKHDDEGRIVTMSLPGFHICNAYVPNSGTEPPLSVVLTSGCHFAYIRGSLQQCLQPAHTTPLFFRKWLEATRVPNAGVGR